MQSAYERYLENREAFVAAAHRERAHAVSELIRKLLRFDFAKKERSHAPRPHFARHA